jgi:hypothetical protein
MDTLWSVQWHGAPGNRGGGDTDGGSSVRGPTSVPSPFIESAGVRISPGDIDEALTFLLTYGLSDRVFPDVDASGFQLLRAFRDGFLEGGAACDVSP